MQCSATNVTSISHTPWLRDHWGRKNRKTVRVRSWRGPEQSSVFWMWQDHYSHNSAAGSAHIRQAQPEVSQHSSRNGKWTHGTWCPIEELLVGCRKGSLRVWPLVGPPWMAPYPWVCGQYRLDLVDYKEGGNNNLSLGEGEEWGLHLGWVRGRVGNGQNALCALSQELTKIYFYLKRNVPSRETYRDRQQLLHKAAGKEDGKLLVMSMRPL